jgi:hypothetical protein
MTGFNSKREAAQDRMIDDDDTQGYIAQCKAAQPEQERNFCSRCGKRTADLTVIHTCTPPAAQPAPVQEPYGYLKG